MNKKIILLSVMSTLILCLAVGTYFILKNSKTPVPNDNPTNSNSPTPNASLQELSEQEKSIFNSNFDMYLGKSVKGTQIKALIATIKSSNEKSKIGTVDLIINGEESMDSSQINKEKTYSVSFEYDKKGLINKIIVEEN